MRRYIQIYIYLYLSSALLDPSAENFGLRIPTNQNLRLICIFYCIISHYHLPLLANKDSKYSAKPNYVVQINLLLKFSWANINTIDNIIQNKHSERMQLLQFRYLQTSASLFILQAKK